MKGYFSTGQISEDEKQNILNQHKKLYNGYKTLNPQISNEQPLYVQDFGNDKIGAVVNNKGEVKPYTNIGINESILDDYEQEIGTDDVDQELLIIQKSLRGVSAWSMGQVIWKKRMKIYPTQIYSRLVRVTNVVMKWKKLVKNT